MKCKACNNKLSDDGNYVECSGKCKSAYHFNKCSGLSENSWRAKGDKAKREWRCKQCRDQNKSKPDDTANTACSNIANSADGDNEGESDLEKDCRENKRKIQSLLTRMSSLEKEVEDLTDSLQFMSQDGDNLKKRNKELKDEVDKFKKEIKDMEKKQNKVQKETDKMKTEQNRDRQYDRNRNIEIFGLAKTEKEDLPTLIKKLADVMEIDSFDETMIEAIHRLPKKKMNKTRSNKNDNKRELIDNVIVQFKSRMDRNKWTQKKVYLTNSMIFETEDETRIYVNEHLTIENKKLLWQTKQKAKEEKWRFVWIKDGKILMRKDEGEYVVHIASESDLKKITERKRANDDDDADSV